MERARAVGPLAASRIMHGPDEAWLRVLALSGLSAGAGQLSEAGPVRVVKVERPGCGRVGQSIGEDSHAKNEHAMGAEMVSTREAKVTGFRNFRMTC